MSRKKLVVVVRAVMFIGLAFVTGWTASTWAKISGINSGLVNALNSVGQNLFGDRMFGAGIINPEVMPFVQVDFAAYPPDPVEPDKPGHPPDPVIPVVVNMFSPNTCQVFAQARFDPGFNPVMIINPDVMPGGNSHFVLVEDGGDFLISEFPPGPCVPPDTGGTLPPDV